MAGTPVDYDPFATPATGGGTPVDYDPFAQPAAPQPSAPRTQALTDVLNRGLVAGTLGAPVDIATMMMRPFGYKEKEPFLGSEYIGRQMERAGMVSPTRRPLGELAAGFVPALATGGAAAIPAAFRGIRAATGRPAREAAEALRTRTAGAIQQPLTEAEQARERAAGVVQQMERQPQVAAERAAQAPLTPEQQVAALQSQVRQPVREQAAAQARSAEEAARQAQMRVTSAEQQLQTAQQQTENAKRAVDAIEQKMLARPTMTAEELGKESRAATEKLYRDAVAAREREAGFANVLAQAGDQPVVNTAGLVARAEQMAKESRNPTVIAMMNEIASLAKTGESNALTLRAADSLRKTLSKDIINKYYPQTGADKEVLRSLRTLRGDLIDQTPQAYKEALGKFSSMSRPLDIVERQGALRKVLDKDPLSTAYKLTEAEVTGQIIQKARAGNPTFSRLLETSPQLKESGRLYFSRDLFGKEAAPTDAVFRNWLATNERPLRQLGLYDEFKSLNTARQSAQRAVDEAKTAEQVVKGTVQAAKEAATTAKAAETGAVKVSKESEKRLEEALKTRMGVPITTKPAPIKTFVQTREKAQEAVTTLNRLQSDVLSAKTPEDVRKAVKTTADKLLKDGVIDDAGYRTMMRDVEQLKSLEDARTRARKILAYFAGAAGLGYVGRGAISSQFDAR